MRHVIAQTRGLCQQECELPPRPHCTACRNWVTGNMLADSDSRTGAAQQRVQSGHRRWPGTIHTQTIQSQQCGAASKDLLMSCAAPKNSLTCPAVKDACRDLKLMPCTFSDWESRWSEC